MRSLYRMCSRYPHVECVLYIESVLYKESVLYMECVLYSAYMECVL